MLKDNVPLKELYLRWNLITDEGGSWIFKSLLINENVRVLDLSFNSLGCDG